MTFTLGLAIGLIVGLALGLIVAFVGARSLAKHYKSEIAIRDGVIEWQQGQIPPLRPETVADEIDLTVFPPEPEDLEAVVEDDPQWAHQPPPRVIETEEGVDKYEVPEGRPVVYAPPSGYHDVPRA